MGHESYPGNIGEVGDTGRVRNEFWPKYADAMKEAIQDYKKGYTEIDYSTHLLNILKNKESQSGIPRGLEFCFDQYGIDYEAMNRQDRSTYNEVLEFCIATTIAYSKRIREIMKEYQEENPYFADAMIEDIINHRDDALQITLYSNEIGKRFLGELEEDANNNESYRDSEGYYVGPMYGDPSGLVLNIDLPDAVSERWYYGGDDVKAQKKVPVGDIAWGFFYHRCRGVIWDIVHQFEKTTRFILNA